MQHWYQHYHLPQFSAFGDGAMHHIAFSCCGIFLSTFLFATFFSLCWWYDASYCHFLLCNIGINILIGHIFQPLLMVWCIILSFLVMQYWYQHIHWHNFQPLVMARCIISPFLVVKYWYQHIHWPQFSTFVDGAMLHITISCYAILVSTFSIATIFSLWWRCDASYCHFFLFNISIYNVIGHIFFSLIN